MDRARRDQQLFADRWMVNCPSKLELHLAGQHNHQFVGLVAEAFPSLAWWIGPNLTTETAVRPIGQNLVGIWFKHVTSSATFPIIIVGPLQPPSPTIRYEPVNNSNGFDEVDNSPGLWCQCRLLATSPFSSITIQGLWPLDNNRLPQCRPLLAFLLGCWSWPSGRPDADKKAGQIPLREKRFCRTNKRRPDLGERAGL